MKRRAVLQLGAIAGLAVAADAALACTPQQAATTGSAAPAPKTDRLMVIQDNVIDSLDVHVAQRGQSNQVMNRVNESLVDRDPKTFQPRGRLAQSFRRVDPLTWEFKLRQGVKFSNGEPFNAAVVKFNFERIARPDLKSAKGTSISPLLDTVTAVDDSTVLIKTKAPYALLLERLTTLQFVPQKYTLEKGDSGFAAAPIGTGPYLFDQWIQGQEARIKRNPDYWGPEKGIYDTIVFRQILEASTAIAELLVGNADVVFGITPDQEPSVKTSGKADVVPATGVDVVEIRMDPLARGGPNPFTDRRVRQAANYAIDKEAIAKNILGGYSKVVATNIVPGMFGHDANVKPYPYDPAKAKQLLSDAGYPNGIDVRFLTYPVSPVAPSLSKLLTEAAASDLGKVGIRCSIFTVGANEISAYTTPGKAGPVFLGGNQNGNFYDGGFGFFYLRKQFTSSYFWSDDLEASILRLEQSSDQEERKRILSQVQNTLHDDAPYIWGWTGFSLVGVAKAIDLTDALIAGDFIAERVRPKR